MFYALKTNLRVLNQLKILWNRWLPAEEHGGSSARCLDAAGPFRSELELNWIHFSLICKVSILILSSSDHVGLSWCCLDSNTVHLSPVSTDSWRNQCYIWHLRVLKIFDLSGHIRLQHLCHTCDVVKLRFDYTPSTWGWGSLLPSCPRPGDQGSVLFKQWVQTPILSGNKVTDWIKKHSYRELHC